jgi:hypothetical protein
MSAKQLPGRLRRGDPRNHFPDATKPASPNRTRRRRPPDQPLTSSVFDQHPRSRDQLLEQVVEVVQQKGFDFRMRFSDVRKYLLTFGP